MAANEARKAFKQIQEIRKEVTSFRKENDVSMKAIRKKISEVDRGLAKIEKTAPGLYKQHSEMANRAEEYFTEWAEKIDELDRAKKEKPRDAEKVKNLEAEVASMKKGRMAAWDPLIVAHKDLKSMIAESHSLHAKLGGK